MAHLAGTFASPTDLLDQLRLFLVAQGWVQNHWAAEGTGYRLHLSKGGWYLNARSSPDTSAVWASAYGTPCPQLGFNLSTGLNLTSAWRDQAGAVQNLSAVRIGCGIPLPAGAGQGFQAFYDSATDSLVVFVEATVGVWRWFGFGLGLLKQGTWTGGQWIASCADHYFVPFPSGPGLNSAVSGYPFGANRCYASGIASGPLVFINGTVDAYSGWVGMADYNVTGRTGYMGVPGGSTPATTLAGLQNLIDRAGNTLNAQDVLLPVQAYAVRDAGGVSLLGALPLVYATNPAGLTPGQAYTLGASQFVPFPSNLATRGTAVKKA